jgi:hypothetical protein
MTDKSNNADASKKENPSHENGLPSGAHAPKGKSTEPDAVFRAGQRKDVRQPEPVRTVDPKVNKGKAIELAKKQNEMSPDKQLAQIPSGRDFPSTTASGN